MILTEYSDDLQTPLAGAVDGTNTVFTVHFPMDMDYVSVLVNGTAIAPDVANGWHIVDAYHVQLNEAPLATDTVAVQYASGGIKGGGGNGGVNGTAVLINAQEGIPITMASAESGVPTSLAVCVCLDCKSGT